MRYRPFGASGKAVSAVSLLLRDTPNMGTPHAWRGLVFGAMESGVNCFELEAGSDVLALGVGEALSAVERRLIFLSLRLRGVPQRPLTGDAVAASVRNALQRTGAGYFDLLMLDEVAYETLTRDGYKLLDDLRAAGRALQIGVAGEGQAIDQCIQSAAFDVLATPFSLVSDWQARRRIKDASAADMTLIAYDPFPPALCRPAKASPISGRAGLLRRAEPLAGTGTYAFLHDTPRWTAEELCLAYTLTEPAFATTQVEAFRADAIERLAAVTDRDLPTGVAAQIEMARFGALGTDAKRA